jgi:hypothetical protein
MQISLHFVSLLFFFVVLIIQLRNVLTSYQSKKEERSFKRSVFASTVSARDIKKRIAGPRHLSSLQKATSYDSSRQHANIQFQQQASKTNNGCMSEISDFSCV